MIKNIIKYYKNPFENKQLLVNELSNFIKDNYNTRCKISINEEIITKRKFSFAYNSFFPTVDIKTSDEDKIKAVYKFPSKFILNTLCIICVIFFLVLFVITVFDRNVWAFCAIPLATLLFLISLSYLMFYLSVKSFSKSIEDFLTRQSGDGPMS